jgi:hypothetical protein
MSAMPNSGPNPHRSELTLARRRLMHRNNASSLDHIVGAGKQP